MLVVEDFLGGVDAEGGGELDGFAVVGFREDGQDATVGKFRVEHGFEGAGVVADGEDLLAAEAEGVCGLAGQVLEGQDAHADQVGAVDALVALGDDELDAEQARAFGGPVARTAGAVFLAGERKTLRAGESVLGPRGVPHGFAGVGEKSAHMIIAFTPAGKMEEFFRVAAVPNGPKMDAELFARYEMQYVGPPLVVG